MPARLEPAKSGERTSGTVSGQLIANRSRGTECWFPCKATVRRWWLRGAADVSPTRAPPNSSRRDGLPPASTSTCATRRKEQRRLVHSAWHAGARRAFRASGCDLCSVAASRI